ncbi:ArsR/SmtB family transcription factor [Microlunatus soli]|nr:metalloregulator ArsR/SmtB family transcription factor [Microlunatus soli]
MTATKPTNRQLLQIAEPAALCAPGPSTVELSAVEADGLAGLLKALADPVRLRLYSRIAGAAGEVCVCDIQDVGVSQPTVSHHLRKLRDAGLIDCERRGTWVYYWAIPGRLDLLDQLPRP